MKTLSKRDSERNEIDDWTYFAADRTRVERVRTMELGEFPITPIAPPECEPDGGEVYHTDCNTREEAIEVAKQYGGGLIAECQQQDFDLGLTGDDIIECLYGQNEGAVGEGDFIECTREQCKDLGDMVTDAILAWAEKHKISLTAWTFEVVRNKETVVVEPVSI
jgi:hypothetical protein